MGAIPDAGPSMHKFRCRALKGIDALIAEDGSTLIENLGIGNT